MAKRLTDTEKWKDDWYISLSNDDKVVWQWLVDNCNHAGICKKNMALLNLMCKVDYTEEQMLKKMENRVMKVKNIWFIPKFLKFQYPTLLSSKPVIISVVKELFANNLCNEIPKDFGDDYIIIKESFNNHYKMIKDKDKDNTLIEKSVRRGYGGKKKSASFVDLELNRAYFSEDGTKWQELGTEQKNLLLKKELKYYEIFEGEIF